MGADITFYVDLARQTLVQGPGSLQPLVALTLIQAEQINANVQMLNFIGNGLAPFVNIDPTGWQLQFALGYIDATGTKQLIAAATTTALTAISGISANTALTFVLNTGLNAAATALAGVHSLPIWAELAWAPTATTAYLNKVQVEGTLETAFAGVGLPAPA